MATEILATLLFEMSDLDKTKEYVLPRDGCSGWPHMDVKRRSSSAETFQAFAFVPWLL